MKVDSLRLGGLKSPPQKKCRHPSWITLFMAPLNNFFLRTLIIPLVSPLNNCVDDQRCSNFITLYLYVSEYAYSCT